MGLALKLLIAPALVWAATAIGRRFGERAGGAISALPVIAGPVLLIDAQAHGARFTASAASGTLLGLIALAGFAVAYAWKARTSGWGPSLAAGWVGFALLAVLLEGVRIGPLPALLAAAAALAAASAVLPRGSAPASGEQPARRDVPLRMLTTLACVAALSALAAPLGPTLGGILVAFPVLASVLAAFTHELGGGAAATELLRGMLSGLLAFAVFCAVVGALVVRAGVPVAFGAAVAATLAVHALSLRAALVPRVSSSRP